MSTYCGVNAHLAYCLNSVLNVKALIGTFNQEKALVGAFSVIVKSDCGTDGSLYSTTYLSVPGEHAEPPGGVHAARLRGLGEGPHQQLPRVLRAVVQRRHHQLQVQLVPQPGHSCQHNTAEDLNLIVPH